MVLHGAGSWQLLLGEGTGSIEIMAVILPLALRSWEESWLLYLYMVLPLLYFLKGLRNEGL